MRPSRNLFLLVAFAIFSWGMISLLTLDQEVLPLPRLPQHTLTPKTSITPQISVTELVKPWAHPPVVVTPKPLPPPVVKAPEIVPDSTSVKYLGSMTGEGDVKTYLFKFIPNGSALTLVEGQESHGWTLTQISTQQFSLRGPGGLYVVAR